MKPGIYVVGTPIGNLGDISVRALDVLRAVQFILAEDTRHTQILLQRYQIRKPLISCHRFNEAARQRLVLEKVAAGAAVALVTNAGMPGVADPGARIVTAARRAGVYLTVIPGASAATAAVALSGFGGAGFLFEGFLPRKAGARQRRLQALRWASVPVVFFEAPQRGLALLAEMNTIFPERDLFAGRELTKLHEECLWGTVAEMWQEFAQRAGAVRGELVLVLAPASKAERKQKEKTASAEAGDLDQLNEQAGRE